MAGKSGQDVGVINLVICTITNKAPSLYICSYVSSLRRPYRVDSWTQCRRTMVIANDEFGQARRNIQATYRLQCAGQP